MIQLQYINSILNTKDASSFLINNIDDTFFSDFKEEFRFIKEHLDAFHTVPDKLTFANKFPEFDFIEVNEPQKYLLEELYKDRNGRTIAKIFNDVRDLVNDGKIEEATSLYIHAADKLVHASHINATNILTDTARYERYVERTQDFSKYYVKTGFKELDDALGGWDRLEELATIVARPGVGKSWVLLRTAIAAAEQGLNVGLYSGEMSELKVGYRADTLIGHISNRDLMRGNIQVQNEYKLYLDNLRDRFKGKIWVTTPTDIGHPATVTDLRAFIESYHLDILCIDQHSLMEDERKAKDPVTRAANISKDLKNLQVLKKIPIIAVSQQNRGAVEENATLDVSHIAQADRIGQDSTCVLFLEQKESVMTMHISKARDATSGSKLKYAVDLNKGIFDFIPVETDALNGNGCEALREEYDYQYDGDDAF